jgi:hypothetical protein
MIMSPQFLESPETTKVQGCPATMGVGFAGGGGAGVPIFWEKQVQLKSDEEKSTASAVVRSFVMFAAFWDFGVGKSRAWP